MQKSVNKNEQEAMTAVQRDRDQRQHLIHAQLNEMTAIQQQRRSITRNSLGLIKEAKTERNQTIEKLDQSTLTSIPRRKRRRKQHEPEISLE